MFSRGNACERKRMENYKATTTLRRRENNITLLFLFLFFCLRRSRFGPVCRNRFFTLPLLVYGKVGRIEGKVNKARKMKKKPDREEQKKDNVKENERERAEVF